MGNENVVCTPRNLSIVRLLCAWIRKELRILMLHWNGNPVAIVVGAAAVAAAAAVVATDTVTVYFPIKMT